MAAAGLPRPDPLLRVSLYSRYANIQPKTGINLQRESKTWEYRYMVCVRICRESKMEHFGSRGRGRGAVEAHPEYGGEVGQMERDK